MKKQKVTSEPKPPTAEAKLAEQKAHEAAAKAWRPGDHFRPWHQLTPNQQQAAERNNAINLLDNVVAKVSADREGHIRLGNAVTLLRASNEKLMLFENGALQ